VKRFDRKFGTDFIANLPVTPAVYLFRDAEDVVVYVGKAKNVRKRLSSYRNASRRKVHAKMRAIVRAATTVEVRLQDSEEDALALENELIRSHEPRFNIDGKYSFLYPSIGVVRRDAHTLVAFTTDTVAWSALRLRWFGCFRSRPRTLEAYEALVALLALLGHEEKRARLGELPKTRGSRTVGLRQLEPNLLADLQTFLAGESAVGLKRLAMALLEKPRARRESAWVQEQIDVLEAFYETDLAPLHRALRADGREGTFVPQDERDLLFIRRGD
jgi:excinuclease ABC subunit C